MASPRPRSLIIRPPPPPPHHVHSHTSNPRRTGPTLPARSLPPAAVPGEAGRARGDGAELRQTLRAALRPPLPAPAGSAVRAERAARAGRGQRGAHSRQDPPPPPRLVPAAVARCQKWSFASHDASAGFLSADDALREGFPARQPRFKGTDASPAEGKRGRLSGSRARIWPHHGVSGMSDPALLPAGGWPAPGLPQGLVRFAPHR